ncbi:MAG: hypothetical protein R2867_37555 [Caldilineaceae bacterium]
MIDEFQNFTTSSLETLLSMARSFGLSVICANQHDAQLTSELVASLDNNCAVRIRCELENFHYLSIMQILQDVNKPEILIRPLQPPYSGSYEAARDVQILSRLKYGVPVADIEKNLDLKWNLRKNVVTVPPRALVTGVRPDKPVSTPNLPEVFTNYGF